ncbi:MAG TPA: thiopeptide-type bacteriocin biosynthesis protein [Streptosporangiaceae bacterium]|nr:thiopeptide-type bacteriocin biosynthesis protein [Streptosporangiaceae bacterium]
MSAHGPGTAWVSAHLFCHTSLDGLLTDAVRPTVLELTESGAVAGFFFLRYWDGGPHVRLRLLARDPAGQWLARRCVRERCGSYLRAHLAAEPLDVAGYAEGAGQMAQLEGVESYHRVPLPDGSLRFIPYQRDYGRYGGDTVMTAVERHFMDASRIALSLVAATDRARRVTAAFCMTVLAAMADRESAGNGWSGAPGPVPEQWHGHYESQRARLAALVDRCRAAAGQADSKPGSLAAWHRAVTSLRAHLDGIGPAANPGVLGHCTHLMCNRLGVPLSEEALLHYLAARALTDAREPIGAPE